jgi:hypothetical protein
MPQMSDLNLALVKNQFELDLPSCWDFQKRRFVIKELLIVFICMEKDVVVNVVAQNSTVGGVRNLEFAFFRVVAIHHTSLFETANLAESGKNDS